MTSTPDTLRVIRLAKVSLVGAMALFLTLVVVNNLTDYGSNFEYVRQVMTMGTTFPGNQAMGRAIHSPTLHHLFYWMLILWEVVSALLCWLGCFACSSALGRSTEEFHRSKAVAIAGLTSNLLMCLVAFITVGGEWFLMWQSPTWNGQDIAFKLFGMTGIILLLLCQIEMEPPPKQP